MRLGIGVRHVRQRGLTLIEMLIAIVVISLAVTGVLLVFTQVIRGSADPMVRKQAIAIAESLLGEVLAQPFTYCDPQDTKNDADVPPSSTTDCTDAAGHSQNNSGGALGPKPATETRFSPTDPFDNVADFHGYQMTNGIYSLDDGATPISGLGAYSASVTVTRVGTAFGVAADAALRIDVTVTGPGQAVTLSGFRFRHSPNATSG